MRMMNMVACMQLKRKHGEVKEFLTRISIRTTRYVVRILRFEESATPKHFAMYELTLAISSIELEITHHLDWPADTQAVTTDQPDLCRNGNHWNHEWTGNVPEK
jgi:hypothetical protein